MKKPIFNQIERKIIRESNSLFSDRMKLFIAVKKFEKAFLKSPVGKLLNRFYGH